MANIGDNTIFSPNVFDSGILGRKGVFETYLLDDSNGTGVLNQFGTDAQAAYSAYDLGNKRGSVVETEATYSNPAIRVRRDSDSTHKSFAGGEFTQIENWVNEDVVLVDATTNNGGFENRTGDNFDDWSESAAGTSSVNAETVDVDSGSTSCRFDIDASNSNAQVAIVSALQDGMTISYSVRAKGSNAGDRFSIGGTLTGDNDTVAITTDWATYTGTVTISNGSTTFAIKRLDAASQSLYFDSVEITITQANGHVATWYDQSGVGIVSNAYESDFSAGVDGWTDNVNVTVAGNVDGIGGSDDNLSFYADATSGSHVTKRTDALSNATLYRVSLDFYIPSANTNVDGIAIIGWGNSNGDINSPDLDTWVTYEEFYTTTSANPLQLYAQAGGSTSFAGANSPTDDLIYIKNVKIHQVDKAHNDATQATADSQPKIVDAGSLVTDANGNYSLSFDGTDDLLSNSSISITEATAFVVAQMDVIQSSGFFQLGTINQTSSLLHQTSLGGMIARRKSGGTPREVIWSAPSVGSQELWSVLLINDRSEAWEDGVSEGTDETDTTQTEGSLCVLGALDTSGTFPLDGKMSAAIFYDTDKSTDRAAIEQAISNTITTALS